MAVNQVTLTNRDHAHAHAHAQLQTYLREIPMAFRFSVFNLIPYGIIAKFGTAFTPLNHFSPWNVDDDGAPVPPGAMRDGDVLSDLDTALDGLYNHDRFLQLLQCHAITLDTDIGSTQRALHATHLLVCLA